MMILNKKILKEFKSDIEKVNNKKWDKVITELIDNEELSFFSEYESYGNWILEKYPDRIYCIPFYNISFRKNDFISPTSFFTLTLLLIGLCLLN